MIEFDCALATDTPGGPKISMMVATNSIRGSIFAVVARRKGGQDDYVMQSFQICSIGWVLSRQNCNVTRSQTRCGKCFDQTVSIHSSDCDCNAQRVERELGAWRTSEFDNSRTASGIPRSRLSEIPDSSWIGSCVDGLDGTPLCRGRKQVPSEGNWENALTFYLLQGLHWRSCAIWRSVLGAQPF